MDRIRSNILKMIDAGAPESDIDAYIQSEGMTLEQVRNKGAQPEARSAETYGANEAVKYGLTGGLGEEVGAAGATAADALMAATSGQWDEFSIKDAYSRNLSAKDQARKAYHQKNPVLAPVAELGGGLLMGGGVARAGAAVPTIKGMAATGAGIGAASGAAEDNENRLRGAGVGALLGGGMGLGMGAVGRALSRRGTAPPTVKALKDESSRLYEKARTAGLEVTAKSYDDAADDIARMVAKEGFDADLHPRAAAALKRVVSDKGSAKSLDDLETLRRVINNARETMDPSDGRMAARILDRLDEYVENLDPSMVTSGNAADTVPIVREARRLWKMARKSDTIEELIDRARTRTSQFSGSGYENALRTEFRNLAMSKKRMRRFTEAEQKAIKRVTEGGAIGNALRALGKAAPTGIVSASLGTGLGGGVGSMVGGPIGAAIGAASVPAVGNIARQGATIATARNARLASELMRGGARTPTLTPEQIQALRALLATGAAQGGGLGG